MRTASSAGSIPSLRNGIMYPIPRGASASTVDTGRTGSTGVPGFAGRPAANAAPTLRPARIPYTDPTLLPDCIPDAAYKLCASAAVLRTPCTGAASPTLRKDRTPLVRA